MTILVIWVSSAVLFLYYAQKYSDSANEFYVFLCNLPWYTWNEENKKLYLTILTNSNHGVAIYSLLSNSHLNYAYLKDLFNAIYTLACIGCKKE
ncbi:unnamed protein product [Acanthoscelides obtectus]|uniref:Uncharacterized protein n=1 Tax=Acanthoscelides obtectus TaxID=200917 RepID=A0A9P0L8K1_ACAOB|nr:unnamed protein product [Acanthoscelides obtectus]CAK1672472.1 hypothetical protein AOBTE_LOCUS28918 [Acanthoscelides obtectus]